MWQVCYRLQFQDEFGVTGMFLKIFEELFLIIILIILAFFFFELSPVYVCFTTGL